MSASLLSGALLLSQALDFATTSQKPERMAAVLQASVVLLKALTHELGHRMAYHNALWDLRNGKHNRSPFKLRHESGNSVEYNLFGHVFSIIRVRPEWLPKVSA